MRSRGWYLLGLVSIVASSAVLWFVFAGRPASNAMAASDAGQRAAEAPSPSTQSAPVKVEVIKPLQGGIQRTTTQPGTVIAFESARLFAKFSGYLKSQSVDIGDHVKRGQSLAEIDAPELLKEVDLCKAALEQANAHVMQADAHIETAQADSDAALAAVKKAEADIEKTASFRAFREKQYDRFKRLAESNSIEQRLVDEKMDEMEAARAAERLAHAGVASAKAEAAAAAARVSQAKADAVEARAKVDVAKATLAKAEVLASYLKIDSPYDGVVTRRDFFRGEFIEAAGNNARTPLLAVDRTDLMRVVVQVPDRDVPFTNPGNSAIVEIDALPGTRFLAKVSRVADAEDEQTRTMRAEIDVPNDKKLLRQGMYGRVTIQLGTIQNAVRIPSSSIVGDVTNGKGKVYVCREGVAHLVPVRAGQDDGLNVEILEGLTAKDLVVRSPSTALFDGAHVSIVDTSGDGPNGKKLTNR